MNCRSCPPALRRSACCTSPTRTWRRGSGASRRWIAALASLEPDLIVNTGDNLGPRRGAPRTAPGVRPAARHPGRLRPRVQRPRRAVAAQSAQVLHGALAREGRRRAARHPGARRLPHRRARLARPEQRRRLAGCRRHGAIDAFGVSDAHRGWDRLDALPDPLAELQADERPRRDAGRHACAVPPGARHLHRSRRRRDLRGAHPRRPGAAFPASARSSRTATSRSARRGASAPGATAAARVPLNVSAGLGHSIYAPVRFACRPEASLLTLVAADA